MLNEYDPGQPVHQQQASPRLLPTTVLEITAAVAHFLLALLTITLQKTRMQSQVGKHKDAYLGQHSCLQISKHKHFEN